MPSALAVLRATGRDPEEGAAKTVVHAPRDRHTTTEEKIRDRDMTTTSGFSLEPAPEARRVDWLNYMTLFNTRFAPPDVNDGRSPPQQ